MKIAQVCPTYHPSIGGVESHVQALSERLVGRGYEVDVLTTDSTGKLPKQETLNGVRVLRSKSWAPGNAYHFSGPLRAHLHESSARYDIIHAHSYHAFPALYAAQSKMGNRLVFTPHYHGTGHTMFRRALHVPWKYYARRIFEKSDRVISVSEFEKGLIVRNFGLGEGEVALVPDGLDLSEFEAAGGRRDGDLREVRVLCVSRLERYKGIQHLVSSLSRLPDDYVLDVVGRGPYKGELENQASRLGVSSRVRFFEGLSRDDLLGMYRRADAFALLSKYEAFGIVVAEALASGLPCVVSRTTALTEWVDDETCFGIDYPIDPRTLAELIAKACSSPRVRRTRVMDWDEVAEKTARIYASLQDGPRHVSAQTGDPQRARLQ